MLIEELFRRGIMKMGPARDDPSRQVGVFNMDTVAKFPAIRLSEIQKFAWIAGEWDSANKVPATSQNPPYTDISTGTYKLGEKDTWICLVDRAGNERRFITFDPFSSQWIYLLAEGAYGIMRSPGWDGNQLVFSGLVTMIGVECHLRQTWTKASDDEFSFVNEELLPDGTWSYVDEWRLTRKPPAAS